MFSHLFRRALETTQPPVEWVRGLSQRDKAGSSVALSVAAVQSG
jgi:hypothetical protein